MVKDKAGILTASPKEEKRGHQQKGRRGIDT